MKNKNKSKLIKVKGGEIMNVVLVLNRENARNVRVMVTLSKSKLKQKVAKLMENDKVKEAFNLMLREADMTDYLPPGSSPSVKPNMILMEDFIS